MNTSRMALSFVKKIEDNCPKSPFLHHLRDLAIENSVMIKIVLEILFSALVIFFAGHAIAHKVKEIRERRKHTQDR